MDTHPGPGRGRRRARSKLFPQCVQHGGRGGRVRLAQRPGPRQADADPDEPLLGAVVQVPFDASSLTVGCRNDAGPRSPEFVGLTRELSRDLVTSLSMLCMLVLFCHAISATIATSPGAVKIMTVSRTHSSTWPLKPEKSWSSPTSTTANETTTDVATYAASSRPESNDAAKTDGNNAVHTISGQQNVAIVAAMIAMLQLATARWSIARLTRPRRSGRRPDAITPPAATTMTVSSVRYPSWTTPTRIATMNAAAANVVVTSTRMIVRSRAAAPVFMPRRTSGSPRGT